MKKCFLAEMFIESKIPEAILETAGICQNCFIKFNEYDEHQTMANQIQQELLGMYHRSVETVVEMKPVIKIEQEENYFDFADINVVEEIEEVKTEEVKTEEFVQRPPIKKKLQVIKHTKLPAPITGQKHSRKSSYSKVDKDAGLLVLMIDGMKHYQCEYCGKKDFTSRSRLKTHRMIHTDERNFMCQVRKL